jgi:hypothetical protein
MCRQKVRSACGWNGGWACVAEPRALSALHGVFCPSCVALLRRMKCPMGAHHALPLCGHVSIGAPLCVHAPLHAVSPRKSVDPVVAPETNFEVGRACVRFYSCVRRACLLYMSRVLRCGPEAAVQRSSSCTCLLMADALLWTSRVPVPFAAAASFCRSFLCVFLLCLCSLM